MPVLTRIPVRLATLTPPAWPEGEELRARELEALAEAEAGAAEAEVEPTRNENPHARVRCRYFASGAVSLSVVVRAMIKVGEGNFEQPYIQKYTFLICFFFDSLVDDDDIDGGLEIPRRFLENTQGEERPRTKTKLSLLLVPIASALSLPSGVIFVGFNSGDERGPRSHMRRLSVACRPFDLLAHESKERVDAFASV